METSPLAQEPLQAWQVSMQRQQSRRSYQLSSTTHSELQRAHFNKRNSSCSLLLKDPQWRTKGHQCAPQHKFLPFKASWKTETSMTLMRLVWLIWQIVEIISLSKQTEKTCQLLKSTELKTSSQSWLKTRKRKVMIVLNTLVATGLPIWHHRSQPSHATLLRFAQSSNLTLKSWRSAECIGCKRTYSYRQTWQLIWRQQRTSTNFRRQMRGN